MRREEKVITASRALIQQANHATEKRPIQSVFDIAAFLASGSASKPIEFRKRQKLFSQGDPANHVFYIQEGSIRVAVTSASGKEAIVALLGAGDLFGESCLVGQTQWIGTAIAMSSGTGLVIEKAEMLRLLHIDHELSDRFISYMVNRHIRTEEDLIDQLFNSSEKRLARTLLLLARYGKPGHPQDVLPKVSQEMLAEMIGTTRSRVNFFMNKFRKLGFIQYSNSQVHIDKSLLSVVLHD
jgi:CRP-like cAMP-binding protein